MKKEYTGIIYEAYWNKNTTSKVYIGQTYNSIDIRIRWHKCYAFKNKDRNGKFQNAIRKYGMPQFRVIDSYTSDNLELLNDALDNLQTYYITQRNSFNNGYNSTPCGGTNRGFKVSEEAKIKMSLAKKGKPNLSRMGKKHSEKTKLKLSLINKGKISPNKGIPMSEQQKLKISKAHIKEIPTVALDENGVYQLVYPKQFKNYKLSPWHTACRKLHLQISYRNSNAQVKKDITALDGRVTKLQNKDKR